MKLKRILVPTDFSELSYEALDRAVGLAREFRARLLVLHSVEPLFTPAGKFYAQSFDGGIFLPEERHAAEENIGRLQHALAKRRIDARTIVATGLAPQVIVDTARKYGVDLIVMSTHGRGGFSHLFLGSVAEKVVRSASCPVLTVRAARTRSAHKKHPAKRPEKLAATR